MIEFPHVIYGDLLNPLLINLLSNTSIDNDNKLKDIFNFLEELAMKKDKYIVEVVQVTVLEKLGDDKNVLKRSYKYMGKRTRKLSDEVERYWGRK